MAKKIITNLEELPAVLTMKHIQDVLGICKPEAYKLAHTKGFPVVKFGRVLRVPKSAFLRWLDNQAGRQEEL